MPSRARATGVPRSAVHPASGASASSRSCRRRPRRFAAATPRPCRVSGADPVPRTPHGPRRVSRSHHALGRRWATRPPSPPPRAAAGLKFVIFTDHGDGTRPPDPPEYVDGVLCLDGVEISTNDGHYVALGATAVAVSAGRGQRGGRRGRRAARRLRRRRAPGLAAAPSLRWSRLVGCRSTASSGSTPTASGATKAAARWRARCSATRSAPPAALASLLDRPTTRWRGGTARRRRAACSRSPGTTRTAASGGRIEDGSQRPVASGFRRTRRASGRSRTRVDARAAAVRRRRSGWRGGPGRAPGGPVLHRRSTRSRAGRSRWSSPARTAAETVRREASSAAGTATFSARAAVPRGATLVAFRNGAEVSAARGRSARVRVERERGAIASKSTLPARQDSRRSRGSSATRSSAVAVARRAEPPVRAALRDVDRPPWRVEKERRVGGRRPGRSGERGSCVRVSAPRGGAGQPVRCRWSPTCRRPSAVRGRDASMVAAGQPIRVSVQLRFAEDGEARWVKSVYVDSSSRRVTVSVADFRRADGPPSRPEVRARYVAAVRRRSDERPSRRQGSRLDLGPGAFPLTPEPVPIRTRPNFRSSARPFLSPTEFTFHGLTPNSPDSRFTA